MNAANIAAIQELLAAANIHSWVAVVGIVALIGIPPGISKFLHTMRERSLTLSTKKQDLLLQMLKSEPLEQINPHRLEAAFTRAYGSRLSSAELRFALKSEYCHELLGTIRAGRRFARINPETSRFEDKNPNRSRFTLRKRELLSDVLGHLSASAGVLMCLYGYAANPMAYVLGFFLLLLSVTFVSASVSALCARDLLDPVWLERHQPRGLGVPLSTMKAPKNATGKAPRTSRSNSGRYATPMQPADSDKSASRLPKNAVNSA